MTDIALSGPVRAVLLTMQASAAERAQTQARLATGLKANSVIEDPINYTTAGALKSRAATLDGLLDGIGVAKSGIETSLHGIEATRKLLGQMRATVEAEIKDPSTTVEDFKTTIFGSDSWTPGQNINATPGPNVANGNNFNITVADTTDNAVYTRVQFRYGAGNDGTTIDDLIDKITNSSGFIVTASLDNGELRFDSTDGRAFFITQSSNFIAKSGFLRGAYWAGDELEPRVVTGWKTGLTPATTMASIGGNGSQTNTFQHRDSSGALHGASVTKTGATTVQQVIDQINADADFGFTAQLTGDGRFQFVSKPGADVMSFHMPSGGNLHGSLGVVDGSGGGNMPTLSLSKKRVISERWPVFDDLRDQLDDVIGDSGFAGSTRAAGDVASVSVNERGTRLTLKGPNVSTDHLDLAKLVDRDFSSPQKLEEILTDLTEAEAKLEAAAGRLTRDLGVLGIREAFTKDLANVLQAGADRLILADPDEEGANMLAIQTRDQLSGVALNLAANADRGVLQLFR